MYADWHIYYKYKHSVTQQYTLMCIHVHSHIYECIYIRVLMCLHTHIYIYVGKCAYIYIYIYVGTLTPFTHADSHPYTPTVQRNTYTFIDTLIYTHVPSYKHTRLYPHTFTFVDTHVHIYIMNTRIHALRWAAHTHVHVHTHAHPGEQRGVPCAVLTLVRGDCSVADDTDKSVQCLARAKPLMAHPVHSLHRA